MNADSICTTLLKYLNDTNEGVRNAAAKALCQRSKESRALVLDMFGKDSSVIDSALDALAPLRATADHELLRAHTLQKQLASLPAPCGPAVAPLRECLREQASLSEGRLIKPIGLFGDTHTMELVRKA